MTATAAPTRMLSNEAGQLAAFANMGGGVLLIGVDDSGVVTGLSLADVGRLNQMLSNAASQHVKPPINPLSANVQTERGLVMQIDVPEGLNKPYVDGQGRIWVKAGADKRQVTAREEMQRMFQQSGLLHADEQAVALASIENIDQTELTKYFERRYKRPVASTGLPFPQLLQNLNLARAAKPNLACMLLFGAEPNVYLPAFFVKAVAFPGKVLHDSRYLDNENIEGTLAQQFRHCMAFLGRNLRHVQGDRGFNSPGEMEIPHHVLEEIIVNALVHRDYLISAPIRLLVFVDRVEIISPGHLPNHLDTSQIRFGMSNLRNPALASHAFHILPYQGLGSGIPRAIEDWPHIEFVDDRAGNQFKVILRRAEFLNGGVNDGASGGINQAIGLQPESQPESDLSLVARVLTLLGNGPMGKQQISVALGQKKVSGQLNKIIRKLVMSGQIVHTLPDKKASRLQQYRLRATP
jgi:ATP-dependent DNA helicase RecG